MITSRISKDTSRLALAMALFALSPTATAQDLAWDYTFIDTQTSSIAAREVVSTPDGGVVTVGIVRDFPLSNDNLPARVAIARYDENGDRLWNDVFATGGGYDFNALLDRYIDIDVDPQGDVYLLTSFTSTYELRRYAPDGTLRWVVPIAEGNGAPLYRPMFVALHPNGSIIVVGSHSVQTFPRIDVRALDASGAQLWRWKGNGTMGAANPATGIARGVTILTGGEIVVHGRSDDPNWGGAPRLYAIDPNGVPLWQQGLSCTFYLEGEPGAAAADANGGIVAVAQTFASFGSGDNLAISRIAANGSVTWCTGSNTSTLPSARPSDVVVDDQGRVFVAADSGLNSNVPQMRLVRLDSSGSFLGESFPGSVGANERTWSSSLVLAGSDVLMLGTGQDGPDHAIVARFAADGTGLWSTRLRAGSSTYIPPAAIDQRENPLVISTVALGGNYPNQRGGIHLAKLVEGGPIGTSYCSPAAPNSTGVPASLRALGSDAVTVDNVTLRADDLPAGTFVLLLASRTQGNAPGVGGGQGTLCLGGAIGRYVAPGQIRRARNDGSAALQIDLGTLPQPTGLVQGLAGETWNFQGWYRDLNPTLTSNLTDGVSVVLQ